MPMFKMFGPHLKSGAAFQWMLCRELASTLVLVFAACFAGGMSFAILATAFLFCVLAGDFIFQTAGFSVSPRWDIALFHQAFLLILFLPKGLPLNLAAFTALAFILFYRLCGGRSGYVIQPICLTLAFLQIFGIRPEFQVEEYSILAGGMIAILWFMIRFPRTMIEALRMAFIFSAAVLLSLLHQMNFALALVWGFAAGELIFDSALAPFSKLGRMKHQVIALILFALFLASLARSEAMLVTGLVMSFFAGWIENCSLTRRIYAPAK